MQAMRQTMVLEFLAPLETIRLFVSNERWLAFLKECASFGATNLSAYEHELKFAVIGFYSCASLISCSKIVKTS